MTTRPILALCASALALLAAPVAGQKPTADVPPDTIIEFSDSDARMNAAIAEARATLPQWLAVLANPPAGATGIAFKFPLEGYEHIWVSDVRRDGNVLHGRLANHPAAPGWSLGDAVTVPLDEVSDWVWFDARGRANGMYTVRVMLDEMSPEEAAAVRAGFGWD